MARLRRARVLQGVALGAVLLLALGLRLYRLGRLSLWADEGHTVWVAAQPLGDYPRRAGRDTCLPLSYLVTKPFIHFSRTDAAARLPAVLFGVASVAVTWAIGRSVGGAALGLLAALLVAVNPLHLHYSQEARMYTMYVCFVGLSALWLLRFLWRPGRWRGALLAGAVVAAAGTHDVSAVWILALVIVLVPVGVLARRGAGGAPPVGRVLVGLAIVGVIIAVMLLPWAPALRRHVANINTPDWWVPRPTAEHLGWVWSRFAFTEPTGDLRGCPDLASAGLWGVAGRGRQVWMGLLAAGCVAAVWQRRWRLVGVVAWGALAVGSTIVVSRCWRSIVGERIWLPVVIPVALAQAGALVLPWQSAWLRRHRPLRAAYLTVAGAAVGVVLALSAFGLWNEYACQRKEGWREAVRVVVANYRPGDVIFTREGEARSDVSWCLGQKTVAWYLEQHGVRGVLRRVPAAYLGGLDFAAGRFEAPPIPPDESNHQVQRMRRILAAGGRVWTIRRIWGEPDTRPPAIDWLERHAARSRSWTRDLCTVTLHE